MQWAYNERFKFPFVLTIAFTLKEPLNLTMIGLIHDIVHFRDKQQYTPMTNEKKPVCEKISEVSH